MLLCYTNNGDNMKKFLIGLGNFIVVPILFGCISFLIVSYGIEKSFSYNNIEKTVKNTIQKSIKEDNSILNSLYEQGDKYEISKEEMNEILEDDTVQTVLSQFIYSNLKGEEVKINDNDIDKVLTVVTNTKIKGNDILSEIEKEAIKLYMKDHLKEVETVNVNNNISGKTESLQQLLNTWTGKDIRIKVIVVTIVSLVLIVLLNLSKFLWLKEIVKVLFSSSLTLFILTFAINPFLSKYTSVMIASIIEDVLNPVKIYSLVVFGISIIGIVIYYTLKRRVVYKEDQAIENIDSEKKIDM